MQYNDKLSKELATVTLDDFELRTVLDDENEEDYPCDAVKRDIIKKHKSYMDKRKKDLEAAGFEDGKLFSKKPFTGVSEGFILDESLFEDTDANKKKARKYAGYSIEYDDKLGGWVFEGCSDVFPSFGAARAYIDTNDLGNVEGKEEVEESKESTKGSYLKEDVSANNDEVKKLADVCRKHNFVLRHAFNTDDEGEVFSFIDFRCYNETSTSDDDYFADAHFVDDHWTIDPRSTVTMEQTNKIQDCIDEVNETIDFSALPLLVSTDRYSPEDNIEVDTETANREIPVEDTIEEEE